MAGTPEYGLASSVCNSLGTSGSSRTSGPLGTSGRRVPGSRSSTSLAGLVIGAVSFPLVLAGVTVGAVLAPIGGSGLPILGLTLRYTDGLAAIERSRFAGMAGAAVRPGPPTPAAGTAGW